MNIQAAFEKAWMASCPGGQGEVHSCAAGCVKYPRKPCSSFPILYFFYCTSFRLRGPQDAAAKMHSGNSQEKHAKVHNGDDQYVEDVDDVDVGMGHLHRRLHNRQIQLIAAGGSIGTALFISIGGGLAKGGPASLFIAYTLYSIVLSLVNNSIAEMSTYMPVAGGFVRLAGYWVDDALGFLAGWNFFIYEALLIPFEITALTFVISFWNGDVTNAGPTAGVCAAVIVCYGYDIPLFGYFLLFFYFFFLFFPLHSQVIFNPKLFLLTPFLAAFSTFSQSDSTVRLSFGSLAASSSSSSSCSPSHSSQCVAATPIMTPMGFGTFGILEPSPRT